MIAHLARSGESALLRGAPGSLLQCNPHPKPGPDRLSSLLAQGTTVTHHHYHLLNHAGGPEVLAAMGVAGADQVGFCLTPTLA